MDKLETGDLILFSENSGYVATIIKMFTRSKWTHVGIVLKDPHFISKNIRKGIYLLECGYNDFPNINGEYSYGVQITNLSEKVKLYNGEVFYRKLDKEKVNKSHDEIETILLSCYNTIKDKPYDLSISDFLALQCKVNKNNVCKYNLLYNYLTQLFSNHRKTDTFICSSLVGYIYTQFNLLPKNTEWSRCEPVTFSEDNNDNTINFLEDQVQIK